MADHYRGTRRYEVQLTARQVAGIVAGSLVTLSITFALGVGFGHRLAVAPPASKPVADEGGDLHVDHADAGLTKTDFTYQHELTKVDPPAPAPVPPKPVVVPPKPAPAAAIDAGTPPTAVPAHPVEQAVVPPVAPAPDQPAHDEIAAHIPPTPPPSPAPIAPPAGADDKFAVQFEASLNRADADRLASKLMGFGYSAYVTVTEIPDKGHFYRVRVGHFTSKIEAEKLRDEAAQNHRMAGMVMPGR